MPANVMPRGMVFLVAATLLACRSASAEDVFAAPKADDLRSKVLVWAAEQPVVDAARQEALKRLWTWEGEGPAPDEFLDRVIESFALFHPAAAQLAQGEPGGGALPAEFLKESSSPFFRTNFALYAARLMVERRMFDEALVLLAQADAAEAVDPAALFFYRAVAAQGVLEVKLALESLDLLLNHTQNVPVRYATTAVLMQTDLQNLREKSLGEIAKMMSDSERRLDLGRAGEKVQGVQERIIANLDELIKKLEAQGGGGGGGSGQNNSNQSSSPAQDSTVKGATGPGQTDPKKLSKEGNWGDLPEKEQAKAKNLINRNFPSHYRQAIETYFKKLATRPAAEK
jgi:hypothetical protein